MLPSKKFRPRMVSLKVFNRLARRKQKAPFTQERIENALKRYEQGLIKSKAHKPGGKMPEKITTQFIMNAIEGNIPDVTCKILVTSQNKHVLRVTQRINKNEGRIYNIPLEF